MTTRTTYIFPLDGLVTCGHCRTLMQLRQEPEARYSCPNACDTPAPRAGDLNHWVFRAVTAHMTSEAAFPALRQKVNAAFEEAKQDDPHLAGSAGPTDDELRRLMADPAILLSDGTLPTARKLFELSVRQVAVLQRTATIQYKAPLPTWSELAGQTEQTINLPDSATA